MALYLSQTQVRANYLCHDALGPSPYAFALLPFQSIYHTPSPPLTLLRPFIQLAFWLLRPCTLTSLRPPETPPYLDSPATRFFILYRRPVAIKSRHAHTYSIAASTYTRPGRAPPYITVGRRPYKYGEIVSFSVLSPCFIA